MTIGMTLDYIDEYIDNKSSKNKKKQKMRKATQADFDYF